MKQHFFNIKTGEKWEFESWDYIAKHGGLNKLIQMEGTYNLRAAKESLRTPRVIFGIETPQECAIKTIQAYESRK
jgi:hypothetical protein